MSDKISAGENAHADELDADFDDQVSLNKPPQLSEEDYNKYHMPILRERFRREQANAIKLAKNLEDWIGELSLELDEFEENGEASVDARFETVNFLKRHVKKALRRLKSAWRLQRAAADDLDQ
jgi:hypothetical protein